MNKPFYPTEIATLGDLEEVIQALKLNGANNDTPVYSNAYTDIPNEATVAMDNKGRVTIECAKASDYAYGQDMAQMRSNNYTPRQLEQQAIKARVKAR